ncbi:L,D-transpeptidase family protein [uncultured Desulfosarcina sp.]|uniref:L,D-transpeptidase family protein n=1 Tax=uncultured Desulfosarcina sp. TaxID=218289 RepID=UPI0029C6703F|nr:L,D-transpeptidase family protein [uncultured Desulfosarcina sp.]
MKPPLYLTILLTVTAIFLSPMSVAGEAPEQQGSSELKSELASAARGNDTPTNMAGANPLIPVARFYQTVGHYPVWVDAYGLRPQGESLFAAIGKSDDDGLESDHYLLPVLQEALRDSVAFSDTIPPNGPKRYLQFDVALTNGVLRYAQHLSQGRVTPESLSPQWLARRRVSTRDLPAELAQALNEDRLKAYFESLHPNGQAYRGLRKALQQYLKIKQSGGWPAIAPGPTLQRGDRGFRVEALTHRLKITDDWSSDMPEYPTEYDEIVEAAVKRFQRRHGLRADGRVGKRTRTELNISVKQRITQLQLNMERWRWFPDSLGDRYLMVNIPAFELSVVEADTRIDSIRAIIGRKRRQTPILSGRMTYLELNPFWNIPRKIARRDILPKAVSDPTYLARQGIRVFDSWDDQARELDPTGITWENLSASYFPYRLRQDPSEVNALGRVKFMFPNPLSVYIHDTPVKSLFNRQQRSFSSGCVRLETPLVLAQYLLSEQGWDRTRLEAAIANGQRQTVVLDNPIPVHLVYFTAWVDADGKVNFREDIYERDRQLEFALRTRESNLVFCSNNNAQKGDLLARCTTPRINVLSIADDSGRVDAATIEPTGEVTGNPMTGL